MTEAKSVLAADRGLATVRKAPRIFTIEGEIGAGKTELAKALTANLESRGLRVCLVLEPVDQWKDIGILQAFYGDSARYAYSFQTYVFATRVMAIHAAMAAHPDADVYIFERSPVTDPVFMCLQTVEPLERAMYNTWCSAWLAMNSVDYSHATALYLRTSPEVCMERVAMRARAGEIPLAASQKTHTATGGVSSEYQQLLRSAHEAFFLGINIERFPTLPPNPIKKVIQVSPTVADVDFRSGTMGRKIIDSIIADMGLA